MSIAVKTADGWQVLGVGEGGSGGSAWGDFTTNGDEQDSGTYGPDAQGRMWKWAEWNVANDYSVNLTGGQYWVLCVGGGDAGWTAANADAQQGQPGTFNEGYWEFPTGATSITVGSKSLNAMSTNDFGMPSSIGDYGTQGIQSFGHALTGRGATGSSDHTGYRSSITGKSLEYATGYQGADRPGRAGRASTVDNRDGCVIIAAVTNEQSDWNPPGALPGLGTWAQVTSVTGMPNRYTYGDWVAFEWTQDGSVTTQAGGLVDALVVGAGGHGSADAGSPARYGQGGTVVPGVIKIGVSETVTVGLQDPSWGGGSVGKPSRLADTLAVGRGWGGVGAGWTGSGDPTVNGSEVGLESSITGQPEDYGRGRQGSPRANKGDGGGQSTPGSDGVVIVRVPAAQAAGVDPATYNDVTVRSVVKEKAKEAVKSEIKSRRKKK